MKKTLFLIVAIVSFMSFSSFAQKYTKGYLKYEVTEFKPENKDDPQMEMIEGMLKGTKTKIYFNKDRALTKINSMGGMSVMKIIVDKDGNSEMYMEMMGQKFLIKMDKKKAEELVKEEKVDEPEFIHHKDKTKDILGLKAHLVEIKTNEAGMKMEMWVTSEIDTKAMVQQGIENEKIGGFPLEYTITMPGKFSMTTKAVKFLDDFKDSVFDFDKTGYEEKTFEDLKSMGMGGGGF